MSGEIHRNEPAAPRLIHYKVPDLCAPAGRGSKSRPREPAFIDLPLPLPRRRSRHDEALGEPAREAHVTREATEARAKAPGSARDADAVHFHGWPPRPGPRLGDRSTRTVQALENAGRNLERAEAQGVPVPRLSFMHRLQKVAQVPVATFDLLLACVATVATLGLIGPAVAMAAGKLRQAVKAVKAVAEAPVQAAASPPAPSPQQPVSDRPVDRATAALCEAREKMDQARQQTGIDFARRGFISRAIGVGVGLMGLGLAIAATVASGGMAAPALVLTAILLRQTIANAHCAWRNLQLVSAGRPGLPMGASALANAMYAYQMEQPGMTPDRARHAAGRSAAATSMATVGTVLALGAVFTLAVPLVEKCIRVFCSVAQRAVLPPADFTLSQVQKSRTERLQKQADAQAIEALRELQWAQGELRGVAAADSAAPMQAEPAEQAAFDALVEELRRWPTQRPELDAMIRQVEEALQSGPLRHLDPEASRRKKQAEQLGNAVFATSTLTLSTSLLVSLAG